MPIRALTQDDLRHLVCPVCYAPLALETINQAIRCGGCSRVYPIVDGLPVLLAARATTGVTVMSVESRPPLPPFTRETAIHKVRAAEDGWNTRDPQRVALAYTVESRWRNRSEFVTGRDQIVALLTRKWARELDYRLIKELWAFGDNRIAVRFAYECHDAAGQWFRSYGNENWEFDEHGLMRTRHASINDLPIEEKDRLFHWPLGRRPDDHPNLTDLGL